MKKDDGGDDDIGKTKGKGKGGKKDPPQPAIGLGRRL